jgi:hypothetical protein
MFLKDGTMIEKLEYSDRRTIPIIEKVNEIIDWINNYENRELQQKAAVPEDEEAK